MCLNTYYQPQKNFGLCCFVVIKTSNIHSLVLKTSNINYSLYSFRKFNSEITNIACVNPRFERTMLACWSPFIIS